MRNGVLLGASRGAVAGFATGELFGGVAELARLAMAVISFSSRLEADGYSSFRKNSDQERL
jgi:hypothetical protein